LAARLSETLAAAIPDEECKQALGCQGWNHA
jgi:hypothetical protein